MIANFVSLIVHKSARLIYNEVRETVMSHNHQNMESVVERIIHEHFDLDENLEKVIWIRSRASPEICLLEVNSDTFATGMVQSFYFPPSNEMNSSYRKDGAWGIIKSLSARLLLHDRPAELALNFHQAGVILISNLV